jgi:hypothetical protein
MGERHELPGEHSTRADELEAKTKEMMARLDAQEAETRRVMREELRRFEARTGEILLDLRGRPGTTSPTRDDLYDLSRKQGEMLRESAAERQELLAVIEDIRRHGLWGRPDAT